MVPRKTAELPAFSDLFKISLNASMALWQLFFIRALFLISNFIFFGVCLVISCFPLVKFFIGHMDDLTNGNVKALIQQSDFLSYFGDWHSWLVLVALFALYITLAIFFFAFYDSGVYSQLRFHQKNGAPFNLKQFLSDGLKFTLPMLGLQATCFIAFISYFLVAGVLGVVVAVIFHFLPWWLGIWAAFPAGLLFVAGLMALFTGGGLAGVYLVNGDFFVEAFKKGIRQSLKHKGRAVWVVFGVCLAYLLLYIACNAVFSVFGLIPLIGFFFKVFLFLVNTVLTIGLNIYLDSLCVAIVLEHEGID
jgi:hypothetical protein